jgi:hypothetical protein
MLLLLLLLLLSFLFEVFSHPRRNMKRKARSGVRGVP